MYMRIHETREGRIIAACDKELIGKVLEEKNICLDLDKYRSFYVGKPVSAAELKTGLGNFFSANLVGKNAVSVALRSGFAQKTDVIYINATPYIQIYKI
ncbi:DUF424 family protein [Candidatus Micrarchaeota archaeon]|nr:DUF424 family protein [Candidatus Micrarchaeota archaeon]